MKDFFKIDNPFFDFMGKVADYAILNILFLVTSCPIITIGTALCAMHEVLPKMAQGTEGALYRTYLTAFVRRFRRTAPSWLLLLITGLVLVFDVTVAADMLGAGLLKLTMPVAGGLLIVWLLIFSWMFLLPDDTQMKTKERFKLALYTSVKNLPKSLLIIAVEVLPMVCCIFSMRIFMGIVMPFYICIGFSLSAALCSIIAGRTKLGVKEQIAA